MAIFQRFSIIALALALGACASTPRPAERPAPTPADRPAVTEQTAEPRSTPEPAQAPRTATPPLTAPDQWWLLDRERDGVIGASVRRAYEELLAGRQPARTVVVAIIDSGIDIEHEDLKDNIWVNEREVPDSGQDEDGNGYVDDRFGWNFIGGPDGSQVDKDTYEVARLVAACKLSVEVTTVDTLAPAGRMDREYCQYVNRKYEEERAENAELLTQYRMLGTMIDQVMAVLRAHLGTDSLDVESVSKISSPRRDVLEAKQIYLQLAAEDITPARVAEAVEHLESLLEYGLNPEFDPRHIVGDNYEDLSERFYGNPLVRGPDAKHGTHVAGIIGAVRGNGVGIDGIAPAVRIMTIRAVPDGDERDKDVANAIRYAVDNGAHIINMSFGKGFSPHKSVVDEAVRYADERGVLLVHAAGNDAKDLETEPNYPNRYYEDGGQARHWIEVGASGWQGVERLPAPFSNYGKTKVDVFAPGVAIRSTVPDNGYESLQGTSMAAPVVSGIAALIMAYFPELTAEEVRRVILESATSYADEMVVLPGTRDQRVRFGDLSVTGGVVNAYEAVRLAEQLAASKR
ncbi:MAG TPA: S8 family peptidase [Longimicrobiales bacterium]|nr:S8 family peptidase [Longimicrobiales bacterium]